MKLAPNSPEAEMIIIGMMLSSAKENDFACQFLLADDFFSSKNKTIFTALKSMYENEKPAELQVLIQTLKDQQLLEACGGIDYLAECKNCAYHSYDISAYAEIVKDKSMRRELTTLLGMSTKEALKPDIEVTDFISQVANELTNILKKKNKGKLVSTRDCIVGSDTMKPLLDVLQERQERQTKSPGKPLGLSTGLKSLDDVINGFVPSNLVILAARPGVGKTALSMHFLLEIAHKQKKAVGVFSLEMSPQQLCERMLSNLSKINSQEISKGLLDSQDWVRVSNAAEELKNANMYFYNEYNMQINAICIAARRMKEVHNIEFLIIDYLQLISGSAKFKSSDSRVNEISEITRMLKLLAIELNIPILCLSQLNRAVENRVGNRPQLSDLRDSGSIEQDADSIIFIHKPDTSPHKDALPDEVNYQNSRVVLLVSKNRHGPIQDVSVIFKPETCSYEPLNFG